MAFSKARRLGDLITANAEQFITSAHITDTAITGTDIHSTFDLTGKTVTVATASSGDNDTSVASTAFVQQEIASLVDSAPGTLNTLNELAAALGDDANFSTTVTNSIATKLPLAGGTLTGDVTFTGTSANIVFDQSDNALEFATNAKAVFGGSLSISRIGNSSYIHETGSGDLYIKGSDIYITDQDNNQFIHLDDDGTGGTVRLKHEGSTKLSTTSTGATLTGTLNIDSNGGTDNYYLKFLESGADRFTMYENSNNVYLNGGPGNTHFRPRQNGGTGNFVISGSNVGIGTTSPENNLHIFTDSGDEGLTIKATGNTSNAIISDANRSGSGSAINQLLGRWNGTNVCDVRFITGGDTTNKDDGEITFHTSSANNLAERMRITQNGKIFINETNTSNYGGLGHVIVTQTADDLGIGIIDDNETNTLKLINNGTVSKIEQNGAIPIQIKNANGVLAEFDTYAVPKMNFHYAEASSTYANVATTGEESNSGNGVLMLKQQISVTAGSKILVWWHSGQILNSQGTNSNPQILVYVTTNSSAPPIRSIDYAINSDVQHQWYPASSQASARIFLSGMGATGTLSTGGTYYIYVYGGSYNNGSFTFNYQDTGSNKRGSNIIWAEVMA